LGSTKINGSGSVTTIDLCRLFQGAECRSNIIQAIERLITITRRDRSIKANFRFTQALRSEADLPRNGSS
jgi:hypothetical protein